MAGMNFLSLSSAGTVTSQATPVRGPMSVAGSIDGGGSAVSAEELKMAYARVEEANSAADHVQRQLMAVEMAKRRRLYMQAQEKYKESRMQKSQQAAEERSKFFNKVEEQVRTQKKQEVQKNLQLQRNTVERLKQQERELKEEEDLEAYENKVKLAQQERWMAAHIRKKEEEERKKQDMAREVEAERADEKLQTKRYEEAKEKRTAEWLASMRKTKRDEYEVAKKRAAEAKAVAEAETKARFKQSEAARIRREQEKRAQERSEAKRAREAHKKKLEEEQRKKREEKAAAAAALKQALKEAAAMQYEADEMGKLRKKADPSEEIKKKMRMIKEEQERMMKERDKEIDDKEKAFLRREKEAAHERLLQIQAASREVAATFKKNQEKELADRLSREAAEKDRFRKIAKEMRWKIEEDNRRKREAELQAAINLKEMKAAQYEADLAAHKRREKMRDLKAKQSRHLQEVAWMDVMEWEELAAGQERDKRESAAALFSEQRATKAADDEELAQVRLYYEQRMKLDLEEKRAKRASGEAQRFEDAVRQTAELARAMAAEVKGMRSARSQPDIETEDTSKKVFSNPFEGFSLALPTFSWGKRVTIAAAPGD